MGLKKESRHILAAVTASVLAYSAYSFVNMLRDCDGPVAWANWLNLFVSPVIVCLIAPNHLSLWGAITNIIFLVLSASLFYSTRSKFFPERHIPLLFTLILVAVIIGACLGALMEKLRKKFAQ